MLHDALKSCDELREQKSDHHHHPNHHTRHASPPMAEERDARLQGIDFSMLRDLRNAFKMTSGDGVEGINEETFVTVFGYCFCGNVADEVMRMWFRKADQRSIGRLSWKDVSRYLIRSASTGHWMNSSPKKDAEGGEMQLSVTSAASVDDDDRQVWQRELSERTLEGKSFHFKAHNECITKLVSLPNVNSILSASSDGSVRRWDQWTLESSERPLHVGNSWVADIAKLNGLNRVAILHSDRSLFFYNVSPNLGKNSGGPKLLSASPQKAPLRQEPIVEYYRGFAQESVFLAQTPVGQLVMHPTLVKKHVPGEPVERPPVPVSLIASRNTTATALAHMSSTPVVETVLIGNGDGVVDMYGLRLMEERKRNLPTFSLKLHHGAVAQVTYSPELEGFLTAGGNDGHINFVNLEKLVATHAMICDVELKKCKPLTQFEYSPAAHHLLVHGYGRNIFVWNALSGVRNHTIADLDRIVLSCSLNAANHRLYALTEGRTVRVYDIRNWRCLETMVDQQHRIPINEFQTVMWHDATSMVVTGAANIVAWRTAEAQRAVEDNAGKARGAVAKENVPSAHEEGIIGLFSIPAVNLIVSIDQYHCIVWSLQTLRKLSSWAWQHASCIMGCALEQTGRKLLIGADDGSLRWVNISNGHECVRLTHETENGLEISACKYEGTSAAIAGGISVASCGRWILAWLYTPEEAVAHVVRAVPCSHRIEMPRHLGIIHAFEFGGADKSCIVAATNSGTVVILTMSLAVLYSVGPPDQTAAELLLVLPHCGSIAATYSNGLCQVLRVDAGAASVRQRPFYVAHKKGDLATCIAGISLHVGGADTQRQGPDATVVEAFRTILVVGDSGGVVSLFLSKDASIESGGTQSFRAATIRLLVAWKAHEGPVSGVVSLNAEAKDTIMILTSSADTRLMVWQVSLSSDGAASNNTPQMQFEESVPNLSNLSIVSFTAESVSRTSPSLSPKQSTRSLRRRSVVFDDVKEIESTDDDDDDSQGNASIETATFVSHEMSQSSSSSSDDGGDTKAGKVSKSAATSQSTPVRRKNPKPSVSPPIVQHADTAGKRPQKVPSSSGKRAGRLDVRDVRFLGEVGVQVESRGGVVLHDRLSAIEDLSVGHRSHEHVGNSAADNPSASFGSGRPKMSKKFMSFSNLLDATERESLFSGTAEIPSIAPQLSPSVATSLSPSSLITRKASLPSLAQQRSHSPSASSNASELHESPPRTPSRALRYRQALSAASLTTSLEKDLIQRPASRVVALRRMVIEEPEEGSGRASVDKRLHMLQRRREEREEEDLESYKPYFGRLGLQRIGDDSPSDGK